MRKIFIVALLLGINLIMSADNAVARDRFAERIIDQQHRIDSGIASGKFAREEAGLLQDNLNWIKTEIARLNAAGILTPDKVDMLSEMLEKNSAMIAKKRRVPIRRLLPPVTPVTNIAERLAQQQRKIDEGIALGELTPDEIRLLQDNLTWIKAEFSRLNSAGILTPDKADMLSRLLDKNGNMIINKRLNPIRRVY